MSGLSCATPRQKAVLLSCSATSSSTWPTGGRASTSVWQARRRRRGRYPNGNSPTGLPSLTVTDAAAGYSGHATAWFGVENNHSNFVSPFIAESLGMLSDGTPLSIHQEGNFVINAQGQIVVNNVKVTCS